MEPPPDDTLMWCLERCLDDPAVPYQVVLGLAQTVTATRTLPDRLKCRLVLRDVEQEAAANRVSQRTVSALQQLAALAEGLRGEGVEEADLLACGEQFLLAVQTAAFVGALRDNPFATDAQLLPQLNALFPLPRSAAVNQRLAELVTGIELRDGPAAEAFRGRDELMRAHPVENVALALKAFVDAARAALGPVLLKTINEDINAGRYMPGMGAVAAALEAAGPAAAPGGPGAAGGFAATGFNLPPIGPADFAAGGPWGGLAAALGPNGLAPSGQLARPGAQPSPDRQAGGLLNGWPLPQAKQEAGWQAHSPARPGLPSPGLLPGSGAPSPLGALAGLGELGVKRERVAGVGGEGVLAGLQGAGEELAALGGHDPLHPVLAAAGAIQRGEDLVAADLLAGRLRASPEHEPQRSGGAGGTGRRRSRALKREREPDSDFDEMDEELGQAPRLERQYVRRSAQRLGADSEDEDAPWVPSKAVQKPKKERRKLGKWTDGQTECLVVLVGKLGEGNWAKICADPYAKHEIPERNQVDLKDKWRNLKKGGMSEEIAKQRWVAHRERERAAGGLVDDEGDEGEAGAAGEGEAEGDAIEEDSEGRGDQQQQQQEEEEQQLGAEGEAGRESQGGQPAEAAGEDCERQQQQQPQRAATTSGGAGRTRRHPRKGKPTPARSGSEGGPAPEDETEGAAEALAAAAAGGGASSRDEGESAGRRGRRAARSRGAAGGSGGGGTDSAGPTTEVAAEGLEAMHGDEEEGEEAVAMEHANDGGQQAEGGDQ